MTFDVNITAMFGICQAALKHMHPGSVDHQHQLGQLRHAQPHAAGVCHHQRRDRQLHRRPGANARTEEYPGQQRGAGTDLDAADRLDDADEETVQNFGGNTPLGRSGPAGGSGADLCATGLGRSAATSPASVLG